MENKEEKYTMTILEASEYYGIGKNTLYVICNKYGKGKLSGYDAYRSFVLKIGKKTLIKKANFEKFLDTRTVL